MSEDELQQQDEAQQDEAQQDEAAGAEASGDDSQIADTVDERADELTGSDAPPSPQPEGTRGDPIGAAEAHIDSLDMDAERKKVQDLQKRL